MRVSPRPEMRQNASREFTRRVPRLPLIGRMARSTERCSVFSTRIVRKENCKNRHR